MECAFILNDNSIITSFGKRVYDYIVSSLSELLSSHFLHVFRETNVLAHDCARFVCTCKRSFSWIKVTLEVWTLELHSLSLYFDDWIKVVLLDQNIYLYILNNNSIMHLISWFIIFFPRMILVFRQLATIHALTPITEAIREWINLGQSYLGPEVSPVNKPLYIMLDKYYTQKI